MNLTEIQQLTEDDVKKMAIEVGMPENGLSGRRNELLYKVLNKYSEREDFTITADGILSVLNDGYGFLRQVGGQQGVNDVYVSQSHYPLSRPSIANQWLLFGLYNWLSRSSYSEGFGLGAGRNHHS